MANTSLQGFGDRRSPSAVLRPDDRSVQTAPDPSVSMPVLTIGERASAMSPECHARTRETLPFAYGVSVTDRELRSTIRITARAAVGSGDALLKDHQPWVEYRRSR